MQPLINLYHQAIAFLAPSHIFNYKYLTEDPGMGNFYGTYFLTALGVIVILGLLIFLFTRRRTYPKFYRRFLNRTSVFLIVVPFLLMIAILARLGGIKTFNLRLFPLLLVVIWLIWFLFMLYYRVVAIRHLWLKYNRRKAKEKYINGK